MSFTNQKDVRVSSAGLEVLICTDSPEPMGQPLTYDLCTDCSSEGHMVESSGHERETFYLSQSLEEICSRQLNNHLFLLRTSRGSSDNNQRWRLMLNQARLS